VLQRPLNLNILVVCMKASCLALILCFCAGMAAAQSNDATAPPDNWVPQSVAGLRQEASSKTEFSLDHSMLVIASKLDQDNEDLRRVIAGINGVSVHNFHFGRSAGYDPQILSAVKGDYQAAGWKHIADKHDKNGGSGMTDLWVRWQNNTVSNFAILVARANDVALISVSGSISPLDLTHLGGHFGIPKIEGGVLVPNNQPRE